MNVNQMRAWIKKRYSHINGRGGTRISVDMASDAQIIATYHSMMRREQQVASSVKTPKVKKETQLEFNF